MDFFKRILVVVIFTITALKRYDANSEARPDCPALVGDFKLWPILHQSTEEQYPLMPNESHNNCQLNWTNKEHIRNKLNDRIKKGEKQFFRLRLPIRYNNITRTITVIWITESYKYMLYFPHNFQTLSLATMTIITENLENRHIQWYCDTNCTECGLGKLEIQELLTNLTTDNHDYKWEYLCVHADYGMEHILSDYPDDWSGLWLLNARDFALPDSVYYWYFLKMLFVVRRPYLGISSDKSDFPNYYCYNTSDKCEIKEVLMNYFIVVYTSFFMWLFCPLLVYYLPSSKRPYNHPKGMFPTYKSPVYFGRCLQRMLCYYVSDHDSCAWWMIKVRRFLFLAFYALCSFRCLLLPGFREISWIVLFLLMLAALMPTYLSVYIETELPKNFPLFSGQPFPAGLFKWNENIRKKREFQRLAYVMNERILIVFDCKFWAFVISNSFDLCITCWRDRNNNTQSTINFLLKLTLCFIIGVSIFIIAVIITIVYYFVPMLFFIKETARAIWQGEKIYFKNRQRGNFVWGTIRAAIIFCHGCCLVCLLVYVLAVSFVICNMINDMAIFTYVGAVITPSMALEYVALLAAVVTTLYTMVLDLHKGYDEIVQCTVEILNDEKGIKSLQDELSTKPNLQLMLHRDEDGVHLHKINESTAYTHLLNKEPFSTNLSKDMYFAIVENIRPIRRQVAFLLIKATLAIYFIGISMWIKNVFHFEKKVSDIFALASKFAIFFLPSLLEFLAYRGHFGRKTEIVLKKEVFSSILEHIQDLSDKL